MFYLHQAARESTACLRMIPKSSCSGSNPREDLRLAVDAMLESLLARFGGKRGKFIEAYSMFAHDQLGSALADAVPRVLRPKLPVERVQIRRVPGSIGP